MDKYDALKLENQLCFLLYASSREIIKKYHEPLLQINLTYTQYLAMLVLWEKEIISVKEMGELLFLDSGTLTPVLKGLEKKEYITKSRKKDDERVVVVELTEKGKLLKEEAVKVPNLISKCVTLDKEDALSLYQILGNLLKNNK